MAKQKGRKLHKNIVLAFHRLTQNGGVMCRQASSVEEALERGGGFIYFAVQNNRPISPSSARFLIEEEIVKPVPDGLFADTPQTYAAVSINEFNDFKNRYEQMPVR